MKTVIPKSILNNSKILYLTLCVLCIQYVHSQVINDSGGFSESNSNTGALTDSIITEITADKTFAEASDHPTIRTDVILRDFSTRLNSSIIYSGTGFSEVSANTGGVSGSIIATLTGSETFVAPNFILVHGFDYTVQNVPAGLTPVLTTSADRKFATLTLSGSATNHQAAHNISDITFTFTDYAFTGGSAAAVSNATGGASSSRGVTFTNNDTSIVYSGAGFSETSTNLGSISGSIVATITGNETFTNASGNLTVGTDITIGNIPAGLTPSLAVSSNGKVATLSLSGSVTNHQVAHNVTNITFSFTNSAFTGGSVSSILNATGPASSNKGIAFANNPSIAYSGTGFSEVSTNTGAVEGSIILSLTEGTFNTGDLTSHVTLGNVPSGLSPTLSFTGTTTTSFSGHTTPNGLWKDVTYGNGLFVAVGEFGSTSVMTSPDGATWTARSTPTSSNWTSVAYGNGLFVVVSNNASSKLYMTSPDGINWTIRSNLNSTINTGWNEIRFLNGRFIAVGAENFGRSIMFSTDGLNWTYRSGNLGSASASSVTYGNGIYVAVAKTGTGYRITYSYNGATWTRRLVPGAVTNAWNSVTYGNGLFVAVSSDGANRVMTSPNGINWTLRNAASAHSWTGVSYGNGLFVAVASDTNRIMTSIDGINWSISSSTAPNTGWQKIIHANNTFVAVSSSTSSFQRTFKYTPGSSIATLTLSGNATNHQTANNVSDITFNFANGAFTSGNVASVLNATGPASSNRGVSFTNYDSSMAYSGSGFSETADNIGSVSGSIIATLTGNRTFRNANGALTLGTDVVLGNVPEGLTPLVAISADGKVATLTLSGNATNHQAAQNVTDITFTFNDSAYIGGNAVAVLNATSGASSNKGVTFTNNSSIAYSGTGFSETSTNVGSVEGTIVATITGSKTFTNADGNLQAGDFSLGNIPTGLTPSIAISSNGKVATLTLSGSATNHQVANNVTNITFTFNDSAFTGGIAASVLNAIGGASSGRGVTFTGNASIVYSGKGFTETPASVGFVRGSIIATIQGNENFTNADGTLTIGTDVALENVPAGFTPSVAISANGKVATLTLSGSATNHQAANTISDVTFNFANTAFTGGNASVVVNATGPAASSKSITFTDQPSSIVYSGAGFSEVSANTGAVSGSIVVTIATGGETFIEPNVTLNHAYDYTLENVPAGLTPVLTTSADSKVATLTLSGNATNHQAANTISNITFTFTNNAFTGHLAAEVSNAVGPISTNKGVTFTNNDSSIAYSGTGFGETSANNGAVSGSIVATITGSETFRNASGSLTVGTDVHLGNIPEGLTPAVAISANGKVATLSVSGSATNHQISHNVSDITFNFTNSAFTGGISQAVLNATGPASSSKGVNFSNHASLLTYSGTGFSEAAANTGSVEGSIILTLSGDAFNSGDLTSHVTLENVPNGLSPTLSFTSNIATSFSGHNTPNGLWKDVTYGNGLYVAVGEFGSTSVMTSPDGVAWTARSSPTSPNWNSVAYGNGLFVAVSNNGTPNLYMTSPDGINWTSRNLTSQNIGFYQIRFLNGRFVAVGDGGSSLNRNIMTSTDGINWTTISTALQHGTLTSVTYGNGTYVAVAKTASNYRVLSSTDGTTWLVRTHPEINIWNSVTYGNGLFVAVSSDGNNRVMTSPDGISWTSRSAATPHNWTGVTYANGLFVAVASDTNKIMTSEDGINWLTPSYTAPNTGWQNIVHANNAFVAVSSSTSSSQRVFKFAPGNSVATLTLSGSATNHQVANNVSDITFNFANGAFASGNAAGIVNATGPASSNKGVAFTDNPSIAYSGGFNETSANTGSVEGSIVATLTGNKTFANADGNLTIGTDVTLENIPAGLVPSIAISANGKIATLTLTGSVTNHQVANNVPNITFDFKNSAFVGGNAASVLKATGPASSNFGVSFTNNDSSIAYSGAGFSETSANLGSVSGSIVATITGDKTFTNTSGNLTVGTDVTLGNIPAGLTASVTISANGKVATLTLMGSATNHQVANNAPNITFDFKNSAFVGGNAALVSNATGGANSNKGVTFTDNSSIAYSGTGFSETAANAGAVSGSIVATITGSKTFANANGNLTVGTDVTLGNIPLGLTASIAISANGKVATLSLTGSATNHQVANNASNITFDFKNSAFVGGNAASVLNATGGANSSRGVAFTNNPIVRLSLKVFLHGPYNTTNNLMNDDLRSIGVIPTTSPYINAPATANSSVFNVTGSNAIVDWVLVEIRDKNNISNGVLARISAFVQRDGDVVAVDGTSEISTFLPADNYYVSIAHRNHLPIVTGQTYSLSSTVTSINFTNNINIVFGKSNAMHPVAEGVYGMFAGDANQNKSVQTTDVVALASKIGIINVYNNSDCNMNGHVQTTDFVLSARTIGRIKQF